MEVERTERNRVVIIRTGSRWRRWAWSVECSYVKDGPDRWMPWASGTTFFHGDAVSRAIGKCTLYGSHVRRIEGKIITVARETRHDKPRNDAPIPSELL